MTRKANHQVVTANHLLEGDAVWFTARQDWSRDIADAAVASHEEAAQALLNAASKQQDKVVGPYLAAAAIDANGNAAPAHFREAFRTRGPSNYFHGKQAAGA
ncbi:MAG: DUF2849 domain-containing protein [Ahrensia sp.]|nr:DUF2849 domain-containing protein [Ahrensia sp.]